MSGRQKEFHGWMAHLLLSQQIHDSNCNPAGGQISEQSSKITQEIFCFCNLRSFYPKYNNMYRLLPLFLACFVFSFSLSAPPFVFFFLPSPSPFTLLFLLFFSFIILSTSSSRHLLSFYPMHCNGAHLFVCFLYFNHPPCFPPLLVFPGFSAIPLPNNWIYPRECKK